MAGRSAVSVAIREWHVDEVERIEGVFLLLWSLQSQTVLDCRDIELCRAQVTHVGVRRWTFNQRQKSAVHN